MANKSTKLSKRKLPKISGVPIETAVEALAVAYLALETRIANLEELVSRYELTNLFPVEGESAH